MSKASPLEPSPSREGEIPPSSPPKRGIPLLEPLPLNMEGRRGPPLFELSPSNRKRGRDSFLKPSPPKSHRRRFPLFEPLFSNRKEEVAVEK